MSAGAPAPGAVRWAHVAERGSSAGIRVMAWIHRHVPRVVTEVLLVPVVAYFWLTGGEARRASRRHFEAIARHAPERLPPRPLLGRTFRHFYTFASMLADRVSFWAGRYEGFDVAFHGREVLEPLGRDGRGGVLLGAHLGSFDVLRVLARDAGARVNVVMFTSNARRINDLLGALDPTASVRVIEVEPDSIRAAFQIRACVERGELVAMLGDRIPPGGRERSIRARFLGRDASFPEGPFRLSLVLGLPIYSCVALRTKPTRYDLHFERFSAGHRPTRDERDDEVRELVERFAAWLERRTLDAPYQWFNFYDFWDREASS